MLERLEMKIEKGDTFKIVNPADLSEEEFVVTQVDEKEVTVQLINPHGLFSCTLPIDRFELALT
jgi:hypothetical protein